jgi:MscS family membrane protein
MDDLTTAGERILDAFSQVFLGVEIWRIIAAGFIMIFALVIRKIVVGFLVRILKKLLKKTKTKFDDRIIIALNPPVRLILMAAGLLFALKVLGLPVTNDSFSGHVVRTLFIFAVFWAIFRGAEFIQNIIGKISRRDASKLNDVVLPFVGKGIKILVVVVAISVIAKEWRYDLGAILAGLGLGGLAFALAAQETLANFFGGLTIMMDKPFTVGDWIQTSAVEGTVEDIGFRSIKVRTITQALVSVPNSIIAKAAVTNNSKMGKRRINFSLGITYQTTVNQIEALLERVRKMLSENPEIHPDTIFVYFDVFGASAYELFFHFYTKTTNWQKFLEVKESINLQLMHILEELGIEVAFPSTTVYLDGAGNRTAPADGNSYINRNGYSAATITGNEHPSKEGN